MEQRDRFTASQSDEGRYRLLIDAITDYAIYMLDRTGIVTSWNPGAQRFKGYTEAEIVGQHFSTFYMPEDRALGMPDVALEIAAREGRFEREGWRIRKDGTRFWAHVVIDAIRADDGSVVGFAKITRDLTERMESERELRHSQEQFRLLVQSVIDYAIYMLDRNGIVTNWNPGAQRIKGYQADEIIGHHFSQFYTPEDQDAGIPTHGLETARREGRWEQEGLRVRKDGSRFWAHAIIDAIRNEDGEVIGFAKITRDVTERREAQRALDEAREALFQSQKLEAVGQLTGGIAHDFNNLLMVVLSSLALARKRLPADSSVLSFIDNAIQGARRGADLTQRMLAFARRQELRLEAVDLPALLLGMQTFLQTSLGPAIELDIAMPADLPKVRTDPAQLETAILNLAVNARDAMPGGGRLSIAAEAVTRASAASGLAAGSYVRLSVSDTGEGMNEETLARATDPFFTTKGVGKGTGLGLSMVHGLASQSGGGLAIRSRVGLGTSVDLFLVVASGEDDRPLAQAEAEIPHVQQHPLRILVVDDDALVLVNTAAMLEDMGHAVLKAASADEALAILSREPELDLVISDQAMPHVSGLQLRESIRTTRPDLPVLIATGFADIPAEGAGSVPRLLKPFGQDELAGAIHRMVGKGQGQGTARADGCVDFGPGRG